MELPICGICAFLGAAIGAALGSRIAGRNRKDAYADPVAGLPSFTAIEETIPQRRPYHRVPQTETEMRKVRGEEPE